jgi:3-oxoacyl-[acyl-carrier protein] reductase
MTSVNLEHFDLSRQRAVVLGADTPGGAAVARAYAEAGADILLCVSERNENVEALRRDCAALGANCELFVSDLSTPGCAGEAVHHAVRAMGGLDILAICPDVFLAKPISDTSDKELNHILTTNFRVPFAAIRAATREMRERTQGGRLLLLTHVLGERGLPNTSAYGAAHAATQNLVRTLGRELGPDGITINAISLGWMDWMNDRIDPDDEEAARALRFAILKRAGRPDDVGPMAVWLSGSGAGYITGQIFHLDGGLTQHL